MKDFIDNLKNIVGIGAAIVGGLWTYYTFVAEGIHDPKIDMRFEVHCGPFNDGTRVVTSKLHVTNIGKIPVKINYSEIRLRQVSPQHADQAPEINAFNMLPGDDPRTFWPMIGQREWSKESGSMDIGQGEVLELNADFLVLEQANIMQFYGFVSENTDATKIGRAEIHTFSMPDVCIDYEE